MELVQQPNDVNDCDRRQAHRQAAGGRPSGMSQVESEIPSVPPSSRRPGAGAGAPAPTPTARLQAGEAGALPPPAPRSVTRAGASNKTRELAAMSRGSSEQATSERNRVLSAKHNLEKAKQRELRADMGHNVSCSTPGIYDGIYDSHCCGAACRGTVCHVTFLIAHVNNVK